MRTNFLEHANLVRYVQRCKTELIVAGTSASNDPYFHADPSSSASRGRSTSSKIFLGFYLIDFLDKCNQCIYLFLYLLLQITSTELLSLSELLVVMILLEKVS